MRRMTGRGWPWGMLVGVLLVVPSSARSDTPDHVHWSFRPILRPSVPPVQRDMWGREPIDFFVLRRLQREGLVPSPMARRETLIRRVTLDLTGMPPSNPEITAFLQNTRPTAYEEVVDRLLASPHYGERWARVWLDVAHYADSDGYLTDQLRPVAWRFRQWVVDALNQDMRFDQFTIEQLAGDLLPDATTEQKIATGFLRQTLSNREGGADVEEFRVNQVKDRISTVGTVWLGLTVACSECHDHKYDPISQREFFELYAFFNTASEVNIDAPLAGELEPYLRAKPAYDQQRRALIDPQRTPISRLQRRWEQRLLEADGNPGQDYQWDRNWEILGLIWGGGFGEGQLEGQEIVKLAPALRTPTQRARIFEYFLRFGAETDRAQFEELGLSEIKSAIDALNAELPKLSRAAVMCETPHARTTFIQHGGVYNNPGEPVEPNTPRVLPALPENAERNRLALARWLVTRENPLTARVTINRLWQEFFGRGFVLTSDDFGARGEQPSHPGLMDWLASEFVEREWSVKRLQRQVVCASVYRQSSRERVELQTRDPDNVLLARQASLRLSAEAVRDSALAVSGLLVRRIGGPSVRPPQSAAVVMGGFGDSGWQAADGEDRYRRALYTFIKRSTPFPELVTFDAPNTRESCTRRERSNTPLQALTLLNAPFFQEASQQLAMRTLLRTAGESLALPGEPRPAGLSRRIDLGFRICLGRYPNSQEKQLLLACYQRLREVVARTPQTAQQVMPDRLPNVDRRDAAAWVGVCSVLLNLHEFITRN